MEQHRESPDIADGAVLLPIEWQAHGRAEESQIAVQAWLEAVLAFPAPVGLAFVLCAGRTEGVLGGLVVTAIDAEAASDAAGLIRSTANALNAWQGLGEPVPFRAPAPGSNTFDLSVSEGPGREIFSSQSAPWALAMGQDALTVMTVHLRGNDTTAPRPSVRCTVTLSGHGPAAGMIATLLAADPPGPVRLEASPRPVFADQPPELALPLPMVAHLVSSPARMEDAWPTQQVQQPSRLIDLVEAATPPHAALFGRSGQGKTTLMEHLVDASLAAGNTVVAVDPHGDLAGRVAEMAHQRRARFAALDFADQLHCPSWNLCVPPPGVTPGQWAAELVGVVRAAWHDMPDEYFGPVLRMRSTSRLSSPARGATSVASTERSVNLLRFVSSASGDRSLTPVRSSFRLSSSSRFARGDASAVAVPVRSRLLRFVNPVSGERSSVGSSALGGS